MSNPSNYIDGFALPVPKAHLNEYQKAAEQIAAVWKEYGALEYHEFVGDDLSLEGTRSFADAVEVKSGEVIVFGWVLFPSKATRNEANKKVPLDPRMVEIVKPLIDPDKLIFDASRMVYGGFDSLV